MRRLSFALIAAAVLGSAAVSAKPVSLPMLPEAVPAALGDSEGEVVVNHCSSCHSLEYIVTQPRGKGAQFWKDSVTKMVNVYKAPIEPADAEAVATVLTRKFG